MLLVLRVLLTARLGSAVQSTPAKHNLQQNNNWGSSLAPRDGRDRCLWYSYVRAPEAKQSEIGLGRQGDHKGGERSALALATTRKLTSEEGSPTHNTRVSIITLEQWVRTSGGRRATGYLIKCHHTTQLQSKLYGHTFQRNGQAKTSAHNRETSRVAIGKPSPYSSKESRSRSGKVDDDARMRRARTSGFTSGSVDPTGPTSR